VVSGTDGTVVVVAGIISHFRDGLVRRHLQSLSYLAKAKGYDVNLDYEFGKYGPYARDMDAVTDLLTKSEFVVAVSQETDRGNLLVYVPTQELPREKAVGMVQGLDDFLNLVSRVDETTANIAAGRAYYITHGATGKSVETQLDQWRPRIEPEFSDARDLLIRLGMEVADPEAEAAQQDAYVEMMRGLAEAFRDDPVMHDIFDKWFELHAWEDTRRKQVVVNIEGQIKLLQAAVQYVANEDYTGAAGGFGKALQNLNQVYNQIHALAYSKAQKEFLAHVADKARQNSLK
jgi:hypothetical protein